jgi:hypothetical protein
MPKLAKIPDQVQQYHQFCSGVPDRSQDITGSVCFLVEENGRFVLKNPEKSRNMGVLPKLL